MKLALVLNEYSSNQLSESFLLDDYSGAAGAYSLRYLSSSYTGDVILVRRSSDNAEEGFTPTEVTDGTLVSFCGAGNGFVKTIYDQSGNVRNATQNTASSQGQIVSSGTLITVNGKPAIQMGAASSYYSVTGFVPITTFFVGKMDAINLVNYVAWGSNGLFTGGALANANGTGVFDGAAKSITGEDTNQHLHYWNYKGSNFEVAFDGSSAADLVAGGNTTINELFGRSNISNLSFNGRVQEAVFYTSTQSEYKSAIETIVNSYYSIY